MNRDGKIAPLDLRPDQATRLATRIRRGEHHWASRLTALQVTAMRKRYACGDSIKAIAIDADIDISHCWRILHRHSWTSVE